MNLTLSPQIKILALVGLLAAVGLAASMFVLGGSSKKTSTAAVHNAATSCARNAGAHATKPRTHVARRRRSTRDEDAHGRRTRRRTTKAPSRARFHGNPVYAQLPKPLQWQLAHHKVVVVSFYNPSSDVDAISVAEAHAGATDAGAGFLLVSVLDNKVAGILTALLPGGGLLPDPGVLVYRAPGDIALRLDGFADRARSRRPRRTRLAARPAGSRDARPLRLRGSRRARSTGDHRRPVTRPPETTGRELFVRHAKKDGRSVTILRAVDYGSSCVVEAEVYPAG